MPSRIRIQLTKAQVTQNRKAQVSILFPKSILLLLKTRILFYIIKLILTLFFSFGCLEISSDGSVIERSSNLEKDDMIKFDVTEQLVITLADKIQPEAQYERI